MVIGISSFFVNLKANRIKRLSFLSMVFETVLCYINIIQKEYLFALMWASFCLGSIGSLYRNWQLEKGCDIDERN